MCPHYHISLQSGCDETLKRMNRKYTTLEYKNSIYNLRKEIEDVAVSTDVMVGFPGETEKSFKRHMIFLMRFPFQACMYLNIHQERNSCCILEGQILASEKEKEAIY